MENEKNTMKEVTYEAKITSKGQVTVPIRVREALGLRPGDQIIFRETAHGYTVSKVPSASPFSDYVGYLQNQMAGKNTDTIIEELRGPRPAETDESEPRRDGADTRSDTDD